MTLHATLAIALVLPLLIRSPVNAQNQGGTPDLFTPQTGERVTMEGSRRRVFYASGELKCIGTVQEGRREGLWFAYHRNGRLAERRQYKASVLHGQQTLFDVYGRPRVVLYHNPGRPPRRSGAWPAQRQPPLSLDELCLTQLGGRPLTEHLRTLLTTDSTTERESAAEALVAMDGHALRPLIRAFEDDGACERRRLLPALERLQLFPLLHRLHPYLEDLGVGAPVRGAIGRVASRRVGQILLDLASGHVTRAFIGMSPADLARLHPILSDPDWLREIAKEHQAQQSNPSWLMKTPELVQTFRNGNTAEKLKAVGHVQFGRGNAGLLRAMLEAGRNADPQLDRSLWSCLPRKVPEAVSRNGWVRAALQDEDRRVCGFAALWLAQAGVARDELDAVIPRMITETSDKHYRLAIDTIRALGASGRRHLPRVLESLVGRNIVQHKYVAQLCGQLMSTDARARSALLAMASHECLGVGVAALEVLCEHLEDEEVRGVVSRLALNEATPLDVRRAAVRAIFESPLSDEERLALLRRVIRVPKLFEEARWETGRGRVARRLLVNAWLQATRAMNPRATSIAEEAVRDWMPRTVCFRMGRQAFLVTRGAYRMPKSMGVMSDLMPRTKALRKAYPELARGYAVRSERPRPPPPRCGPGPRGMFAPIQDLGSSILPALVRQLGHKDPKKRATVVEALAWTARRWPPRDHGPGIARVSYVDPSDVLPHILPFLVSEDRQLRKAALRGLAVIGSGYAHSVPRIAAMLDDRDLEQLANRALVRLGSAAAPPVPQLLSQLGDDSRSYLETLQSLSFLAAIGPDPKTVLPEVLALLHAGKPRAISAIVRILPESVEAARAMVKAWKRYPKLRYALLQAFHRMGPAAYPALPLLVKDLDPLHILKLEKGGAERRLRIIGNMGPAAKAVAPVLLQHFKRPGVPSGLALVSPERLLARLRGHDLCDPVWQRLESKEPFALLRIMDALPPRVQQSLSPRLGIPDFRYYTSNSSIPLGDPPLTALAAVLRLGKRSSHFGAAGRLLCRDPGNMEIVHLLEDYNDPMNAKRPLPPPLSTSSNMFASKTQAESKMRRVHLVRGWLTHEDPRCRRAACELLVRYGMPLEELLPEVRKLRADCDPRVRAAAGMAFRTARPEFPTAAQLSPLIRKIDLSSLDRLAPNILRPVLPALLRRLENLSSRRELPRASSLSRALAKTGRALADHLPTLERILRGRCAFASKWIAIQLLGDLGAAARPALATLRSIPEDDPLHLLAAAAIERVR